jgi:arylsulfatase A
MGGIAPPSDVPFNGKSQLPFLIGKTQTHREWIYAYTGAVQVFRTHTHLLEARAPAFNKPDGRLYYTGDRRFGDNYIRVDTHPEHARAQKQFRKLIADIPSHLEAAHPFWASKFGLRWKTANPDPSVLAEKQLYNHKEYQRYDETD